MIRETRAGASITVSDFLTLPVTLSHFPELIKYRTLFDAIVGLSKYLHFFIILLRTHITPGISFVFLVFAECKRSIACISPNVCTKLIYLLFIREAKLTHLAFPQHNIYDRIFPSQRTNWRRTEPINSSIIVSLFSCSHSISIASSCDYNYKQAQVNYIIIPITVEMDLGPDHNINRGFHLFPTLSLNRIKTG